MKILITGANGFIGRHLSHGLSHKHKLNFVVRRSQFGSNLGSTIIADLADANFIEGFPNEIDCVIHLAQSNRYREFPDGADDMRVINIDATARILEWARITKVKQFIYFSTANVYGESSGRLNEDSPTQPGSYYGATKLAAEHLALQYQKYFQVDVLRCFAVYGPGQVNMLISNLIEKIRAGEAINLAKGVGLVITPTYIGDLVGIIQNLISLSNVTYSRLANVCGDEEINLNHISHTIGRILGIQPILVENNNNIIFFKGSNAKLKGYIGNIEFRNMEYGLKETLKKDRF